MPAPRQQSDDVYSVTRRPPPLTRGGRTWSCPNHGFPCRTSRGELTWSRSPKTETGEIPGEARHRRLVVDPDAPELETRRRGKVHATPQDDARFVSGVDRKALNASVRQSPGISDHRDRLPQCALALEPRALQFLDHQLVGEAGEIRMSPRVRLYVVA